MLFRTVIIGICFTTFFGVRGQEPDHSVARKWNEALLVAIRNDFARPTIHARNLFHISAAMYDAWGAYDQSVTPYLLGQYLNGKEYLFEGITPPENIKDAQEEAISYAAYRILHHRFESAPGKAISLSYADSLMESLGYDPDFTSTDYSSGSPAALGNYIGDSYIDFGKADGSNELGDYESLYYQPANNSLIPNEPGSQDIDNPNRWQPLFLITSIDQSGNSVDRVPEFLSPEWGNVYPFALTSKDLTLHYRDGDTYQVYHDPGPPPHVGAPQEGLNYHWGHSLVARWSSQMDPGDGVLWDISPASIGNVKEYPTSVEGLPGFYDEEGGGDFGEGHDLNPVTGEPYEEQPVLRGDYTRVLAEFWADGPDSETPPGHWFTILNYVNDHPLTEKRYQGQGPVLDDLEWDVKAYFVLAGAMHDAAVSAWSIKGWYDYIRPISAIRYMADQGQCTDPGGINYSINGIPLIDGYIEQIKIGDPLAGEQNENVDKIKLYAWKGPKYINDPETEQAGVGWILAENWWPYQRPSFVTPPFAGYVSGHSTFSRAAAEVLTQLTGSAYFPGGMGEFVAPKNQFLVFEEGPSEDVVLQWATYRDASDQCSLSRIWGGIHPPADDIPGRLIGIEIGNEAFDLADRYFNGYVVTSSGQKILKNKPKLYPNPVTEGILSLESDAGLPFDVQILRLDGKILWSHNQIHAGRITVDVSSYQKGMYLLKWTESSRSKTLKFLIK